MQRQKHPRTCAQGGTDEHSSWRTRVPQLRARPPGRAPAPAHAPHTTCSSLCKPQESSATAKECERAAQLATLAHTSPCPPAALQRHLHLPLLRRCCSSRRNRQRVTRVSSHGCMATRKQFCKKRQAQSVEALLATYVHFSLSGSGSTMDSYNSISSVLHTGDAVESNQLGNLATWRDLGKLIALRRTAGWVAGSSGRQGCAGCCQLGLLCSFQQAHHSIVWGASSPRLSPTT